MEKEEYGGRKEALGIIKAEMRKRLAMPKSKRMTEQLSHEDKAEGQAQADHEGEMIDQATHDPEHAAAEEASSEYSDAGHRDVDGPMELSAEQRKEAAEFGEDRIQPTDTLHGGGTEEHPDEETRRTVLEIITPSHSSRGGVQSHGKPAYTSGHMKHSPNSQHVAQPISKRGRKPL